MLGPLAQLEFPSSAPDELDSLLGLFAGLIGFGLLLGILGHVFRSRTMVAVPIGLVMVASGVFVVAIFRFG